MVTSDIEVIIIYKVKGDDSWHELFLQPSEYFDLDEGESIALDSVPHKMHAAEYLEIPIACIAYTLLTIESKVLNERVEIKETFWNQGKNRIIERNDYADAVMCHCEVVVQTEISPRINEVKTETIRYQRKEKFNELLSYALDG